MKKYNAEEARDKTIVSHGRTSMVSAQIASLKVGELLEITRQDWKGKRPPYGIVNRVAKKTGRVFERGKNADGTAWLVRRIS